MCAECEVALLQLHDFEELITYLKVSIASLSWGSAALTCHTDMAVFTDERARL